MISANADTLVIVKAKNAASKKKIRSALKKYREELIQDTCQYPMNQLKIQSLCKRKLCMLYHAWNNQQQAGGTVRGQSDCCI